MTFFIDLRYTIKGLSNNVLYTGSVDWWANQVPEKGDHVTINHERLGQEVTLVVESRNWSLLRQTGGANAEHDVTVLARGTV